MSNGFECNGTLLKRSGIAGTGFAAGEHERDVLVEQQVSQGVDLVWAEVDVDDAGVGPLLPQCLNASIQCCDGTEH
jgi:hypothetical protein